MKDPSPSQLSALAVLLGHPVLAADPLLLCSAARVCSSWRAAVVASGPGVTPIVLQDGPNHPEMPLVQGLSEQNLDQAPPEQLLALTSYVRAVLELRSRLEGVADWLQSNAQVVHSLTLSGDTGAAASTHIAEALQLPNDDAEGTALPLPHLWEFSADELVDSRLVAALPGSLTSLKLSGIRYNHEGKCPNMPVANAVRKLTKLRSLCLTAADTDGTLDLSPLSGLCHLTRLDLDLHCDKVEWAKLVAALPHLTVLQVLRLQNFHYYHDLDWTCGSTQPLVSLTALRDCYLQLTDSMLVPGTKLPPQLSRLELDCTELGEQPYNIVEGLDLWSVAGLRVLKLSPFLLGIEQMSGTGAALQQLTQVTSLHLKYIYQWAVLEDCKQWGKLPALMALEFSYDVYEDDRGWAPSDAEGVFAGIGAASGLTRLDVVLPVEESELQRPVELCHHLSGLTKLQGLHIRWVEGDIAARDGMQLSSLRGLTGLSLQFVGDAVDDTVAVALVANMPDLRELELSHCGLRTDAVLPLLAQRPHTQLKKLELAGNDGFTAQMLADIAGFNSTGQPRLSSLLL